MNTRDFAGLIHEVRDGDGDNEQLLRRMTLFLGLPRP